jgi:predicted nucleic acid-binding protein
LIVLDANVLIAHLSRSDQHHGRAETLLETINSEPWGVSAITLAEVLVYPARAGRLADAEAALVGLEVQEVPLGSAASGRLAEMRAELGLKMPDCCVLLAAQNNEAPLATFDSELLAAAEKLGIKVIPGAPA